MKRYKSSIIIALSIILTLNTGCTAKLKSKYTIKAKALTESVQDISSADNKTAMKMLNATYDLNKEKNTVISPISLSTVLALTENGAAGNTKEEMLKAIGMEGLTDAVINEEYKNVIANYNSVDALKLRMANSIWIEKSTNIKNSFINMGKDYYEAEVSSVDFTKSKTTNTINSWISDHTAGKIKKIVDKFDENTAMVLVNTVYFKGDWRVPFEKKATIQKTFINYDSSKSSVKMMHGTILVDYFKGSDFSAARLPYKDDNFGMYIFLPNEGTSINDFMKEMNIDNWNKWKSAFSQKSLIVEIPKFHIEFEQMLNNMLKGFGMRSAFEPGADFSNMSPENNLFINFVKQKCFIDVDEKGTEAAASTAVSASKSAANLQDDEKFIADRPFIYVMEDKKTGIILFMGAVVKL